MNRAATIALAPLSLVYGVLVTTRSALYRKGIFKTHRVTAPVISVGNITTGGTGKTPLVEWLARRMAGRGARVCILTRGYGRANAGERVLVSDGSQILADVDQSGDEAMMLAQALLGKSAVLCEADRVAGARWAIENLNAGVLILDDGFQHERLARDLEIVTVDSLNPWSNGWVLPAGRLREPFSSLRRAGCFVATRAQQNEDVLREQIRKHSDAPIFFSQTVVREIAPFDSHDNPAGKASLSPQPIAAFCGIGNPTAFMRQLRDENLEVAVFEAFRDHHRYSQADIDRVTQRAIAAGATALVTTAKDAVKLRSLSSSLPLFIVEIEIEISEPDKLLALIETAIKAKRSAE